MATKPKFKYVVELVVETETKVTKKAVREYVQEAMIQSWWRIDGVHLEHARIRSVDIV